MTVDTLDFTPMSPAHIDAAAALSRAQGWPHGPEDWAMALSLGKGVVALRDGRVVATAIAGSFGPVAMASMIIVDETLRGRGLGRRLMTEVMALASPQEWRLVATSDGLPLYRRLGFAEHGPKVLQHQGVAVAPAAAPPLTDAAPAQLGEIAALDREATGMERAPLIAAIAAAGRVLVLDAEGAAPGFACLRRFGRGEVAGPIVATGPETARALLAGVLSLCDGRFLRVDTTEDCDLATFLTEYGLAPAGGGVPMRFGAPVAASGPARRFALASQALG